MIAFIRFDVKHKLEIGKSANWQMPERTGMFQIPEKMSLHFA